MAVLVAGVAVLQVYGLSRKIIRLPEDQYLATAYDLRVDGRDRIGFAYDHHGVMLVRTTTATTLGSREPEEEEEPENIAFMRAELRSLPLRAAAEGSFYLIIAIVLLLVLVRTSRASAFRAGYLAALGMSAMWWLLLVPLWFGYGPPLYSTWIGPGAASSSGPYFEAVWIPGLTVTYRPVVEALALWPVRVGERVAVATFGEELPWPLFLGLVGTPATVLIGGFAGATMALLRRRLRRAGEAVLRQPAE